MTAEPARNCITSRLFGSNWGITGKFSRDQWEVTLSERGRIKSRFFTVLLGSENYFILMNYVLLCKLWNERIYMKTRDSVFFVSVLYLF